MVVALLFGMIYKYPPDVRITWRDVGIGAGVTALLFTAGRYFIGLYLGRMAIAGAYGAAGSFAALIFFFGHLNFGHSILFRISDFVLRIYRPR